MPEDGTINLPGPLPLDRWISTVGKEERQLEQELSACAREGFRVTQIIGGDATMKARGEIRSPLGSSTEIPPVPRSPFECVIWMHASEESVEYACVGDHLQHRWELELKQQEGFQVIGHVPGLIILERVTRQKGDPR